MNEEEFRKYVNETLTSIFSKIDYEEKEFINHLVNRFNDICDEKSQLQQDKERLRKALIIKNNQFKKLQNNWKKLRKCLEEKLEKNKRDIFLSNNSISSSLISCENDGLRYSLNKMQELEGNNE